MQKSNSINYKVKKMCPICNNPYIKKYLSTHIKNIHPDAEYSKIVKRGIKYNFKKSLTFLCNQDNCYCHICKKIIKKKSFSSHEKSFLHKQLLLRNKNEIFTEVENKNYKQNIKSRSKEIDNNIREDKNQKYNISNENKKELYENIDENNIKYKKTKEGFIPLNFEHHNVSMNLQDESKDLINNNLIDEDENSIYMDSYSENSSFKNSIESNSFSNYGIEELKIKEDVE